MLQTLAPDSSKKPGDRSEREWDEQGRVQAFPNQFFCLSTTEHYQYNRLAY